MLMQTLILLVLAAGPQAATHHAAQVMGFDQEKTVHHFHLYADGGSVEVAVKEAGDTTDRDAIHSHLPHIARMFGGGDFEAPMLVHDSTNVPGTATLTKLKDRVTYTYVESPAGGRVDIVTTDKTALAALHEFLRYQIREHHTGDPATVTPRK
jgi:hypothetical protein